MERFADVIGCPEWITHPSWGTQKGRSDDRAAINAAISAITATMPADHWIELFETAGIPCGPINSIDRVFADPQVQHLKMARPDAAPPPRHQQVVSSAINLGDLPKDIRSPTPTRGADTDAVLASVGYDASTIAAMRAKGAVG